MKYTTSQESARELLTAVLPYGVVRGADDAEDPLDKSVITERRSNGQHIYLTYKTETAAHSAAHRASSEIPTAEVATWAP